MRTIVTTIKQKVSLRSTSFVVSLLLSILAIPAAVLAYGPARPTFTQANPATYVTFDSITDDPTYGDERNFFRVRDISTNEHYSDTENLVSGKEYEAQIFYHNNASSSLNASGVGIAHGAYARAEMPAVVRKGETGIEAEAFLGASNANPTSVYDYIRFNNTTAGDIALRYVAGSTKIFNKGATNGHSLGDTSLFGSTGTPLGYDSLNGDLPGCDQYSGYITFHFVAVQPNFTFAKDVRLAGSKTWQNKLTVNPGATVEYELSYKNSGNTQQDNVVFRDIMPKGLTYVPGQTKLYNVNNPSGKAMDDSINAGGINIGNYTTGSDAYLILTARIESVPCAVLTNTASAETNNGNLQGSATVTVAGSCAVVTKALPTTGPVEIIASLMGVGAITLGVVYYMKSRRDLEDVLMDAQSHPTTGKSLLSSAHETTVTTEDKSKKSEHKK